MTWLDIDHSFTSSTSYLPRFTIIFFGFLCNCAFPPIHFLSILPVYNASVQPPSVIFLFILPVYNVSVKFLRFFLEKLESSTDF